MPELLFIYGTLHPDRAPAEIAPIARSLTPVGPATVRGTLLDLGAYPGIRLSSAGTEVQGHLFALPVPSAATWAALDRYEDFRPHGPPADHRPPPQRPGSCVLHLRIQPWSNAGRNVAPR
jgi:gamma-glutamylcyclotransferase (GGCT)/AIG2-like uncharacterized protein YtfP